MFSEINDIKSYILGFIYADGCVCKNGNETSIEIGEKDFENIKNIINKLGGWSINKRKRLSKQTGKVYITYRFRYFSNLTNLFLAENDYNAKSYVTPFKILNMIPKELHSHFFRGYIDGDGSFSFYGESACKFNITSTIEQDWSAIEELFKEINISVYKIYKYIRKSGNSSLISISNKWDIMKLGEYLYKGSDDIRLERKFEKYLEIKNSNIQKRNNNWSVDECSFLMDNYKSKGIGFCSENLKRSKNAINTKIYELKKQTVTII